MKLRGEATAARNYFLVFLVLPQGSDIVHRFCTAAEFFCIAGNGLLAESVSSENVMVPVLAG
jgi:hypothetical protein